MRIDSIPKMSGEQFIELLRLLKFEEVTRQGIHVVMARQSSERLSRCVVPLLSELKYETMLGILEKVRPKK